MSLVRKFHPVALLLTVAFMMITATIWQLNTSFEKKIVPVIMSASLYFIISFFEFHRIDKELTKGDFAIMKLTIFRGSLGTNYSKRKIWAP